MGFEELEEFGDVFLDEGELDQDGLGGGEVERVVL